MRRKWLAAGVVLVLALAACAGLATSPSDTSSGRPGAGSASQRLDQQERVNRRQAEDEVRRLLSLARIPPGAAALRSAPASLSGPAAGIPSSGSYASQARFWRVPMPFSALDDYVRQHPPVGLAEEVSSSAAEDDLVIHGYSWRDGEARGSAPGGQLSIGVAGSGEVSYLRVDARSDWLDPHPIRDAASGSRLRLDTGESCPATDRDIVGVRNEEAEDLYGALAPTDAPASGRVCVYAGLADQSLALPRQRPLSRAEVTRVAAAAHSVELAHPDNAVTHCPGRDGSTMVLVLTYPSRPAVDLWIRTAGCPTAANGHVVASQSVSLSALIDLVSKAAG